MKFYDDHPDERRKIYHFVVDGKPCCKDCVGMFLAKENFDIECQSGTCECEFCEVTDV
jgi:hypothetical protein